MKNSKCCLQTSCRSFWMFVPGGLYWTAAFVFIVVGLFNYNIISETCWHLKDSLNIFKEKRSQNLGVPIYDQVKLMIQSTYLNPSWNGENFLSTRVNFISEIILILRLAGKVYYFLCCLFIWCIRIFDEMHFLLPQMTPFFDKALLTFVWFLMDLYFPLLGIQCWNFSTSGKSLKANSKL